jgi:hypothetical protein
LPLLIPATALLLLTGWNLAVRGPRIRAERNAHRPLIALADEVDALRLGASDQQAADLAAQSAAASRLLLEDPQQISGLLRSLKKMSAGHGWEANFQAIDTPPDSTEDDTTAGFVNARGRLSPAPANSDRFSSLLALLEEFSTAEKRIDLTRLGIRADEQGRYAVELNLRVACRLFREKTAQ